MTETKRSSAIVGNEVETLPPINKPWNLICWLVDHSGSTLFTNFPGVFDIKSLFRNRITGNAESRATDATKDLFTSSDPSKLLAATAASQDAAAAVTAALAADPTKDMAPEVAAVFNAVLTNPTVAKVQEAFVSLLMYNPGAYLADSTSQMVVEFGSMAQPFFTTTLDRVCPKCLSCEYALIVEVCKHCNVDKDYKIPHRVCTKRGPLQQCEYIETGDTDDKDPLATVAKKCPTLAEPERRVPVRCCKKCATEVATEFVAPALFGTERAFTRTRATTHAMQRLVSKGQQKVENDISNDTDLNDAMTFMSTMMLEFEGGLRCVPEAEFKGAKEKKRPIDEGTVKIIPCHSFGIISTDAIALTSGLTMARLMDSRRHNSPYHAPGLVGVVFAPQETHRPRGRGWGRLNGFFQGGSSTSNIETLQSFKQLQEICSGRVVMVRTLVDIPNALTKMDEWLDYMLHATLPIRVTNPFAPTPDKADMKDMLVQHVQHADSKGFNIRIPPGFSVTLCRPLTKLDGGGAPEITYETVSDYSHKQRLEAARKLRDRLCDFDAVEVRTMAMTQAEHDIALVAAKAKMEAEAKCGPWKTELAQVSAQLPGAESACKQAKAEVDKCEADVKIMEAKFQKAGEKSFAAFEKLLKAKNQEVDAAVHAKWKDEWETGERQEINRKNAARKQQCDILLRNAETKLASLQERVTKLQSQIGDAEKLVHESEAAAAKRTIQAVVDGDTQLSHSAAGNFQMAAVARPGAATVPVLVAGKTMQMVDTKVQGHQPSKAIASSGMTAHVLGDPTEGDDQGEEKAGAKPMNEVEIVGAKTQAEIDDEKKKMDAAGFDLVEDTGAPDPVAKPTEQVTTVLQEKPVVPGAAPVPKRRYVRRSTAHAR